VCPTLTILYRQTHCQCRRSGSIGAVVPPYRDQYAARARSQRASGADFARRTINWAGPEALIIVLVIPRAHLAPVIKESRCKAVETNFPQNGSTGPQQDRNFSAHTENG
jgi:hypothetical protein